MNETRRALSAVALPDGIYILGNYLFIKNINKYFKIILLNILLIILN